MHLLGAIWLFPFITYVRMGSLLHHSLGFHECFLIHLYFEAGSWLFIYGIDCKIGLDFYSFRHPQPLSRSVSPNLILSLTSNLFLLRGCQQSGARRISQRMCMIRFTLFGLALCHGHQQDMPRLVQAPSEGWVKLKRRVEWSLSTHRAHQTVSSDQQAREWASPDLSVVHRPWPRLSACMFGS